MMKAEGVETTYQLFGKFLSFKGPGMSVSVHVDLFHAWLKDIGISGHRNAITKAVAEKCSAWLPMIYNPADFEEES